MAKTKIEQCMIRGCKHKIRSLGFCNHHYMQWRRYGHPLATELQYFPHGHRKAASDTKEYRAWQCMIKRCTNPKNPGYKHYGGRGISVCERWRHSFNAFFEDMGECPKDLTLERQDNEGNYEPNNCIWATRTRQNVNRRTTIFTKEKVLELKKRVNAGETASDVARQMGAHPNTAFSIIKERSWAWVKEK